MDLYQRVVLGIAIVLLIAAYIMIYFTLVDNNKSWPPTVPKCPDGWTYQPDTDNCSNGGDVHPDSLDSHGKSLLSEMTKCENYNWATTNSVSWDGLSYGVHIDCSNK